MSEGDLLQCPFCKMQDFDHVGLWMHLAEPGMFGGACDAFDCVVAQRLDDEMYAEIEGAKVDDRGNEP